MAKKLALFLMMFIILSTVAYAQEEANAGLTPDSKLYAFDRLGEKIRLLFKISSKAKADYLVQLADERASEIEASESADARITAENLREEHLAKVESLTEKLNDEQRADILEKIQKHRLVLERVLEKVPDQAKKGIERALANSDLLEMKVEDRITEKNVIREDVRERLNSTHDRIKNEDSLVLPGLGLGNVAPSQ